MKLAFRFAPPGHGGACGPGCSKLCAPLNVLCLDSVYVGLSLLVCNCNDDMHVISCDIFWLSKVES